LRRVTVFLDQQWLLFNPAGMQRLSIDNKDPIEWRVVMDKFKGLPTLPA
jgi:hypothetical protein